MPVGYNLMHPKTKFLIRPAPEEGQARQDYLMVLAEKNGLPGTTQICNFYRLHFDLLMLIDDDEMSSLFRGDLSSSAVWRKYHLTIKNKSPLDYRASDHARVCPLCLSLGRPMLKEFDYGFSMSCQVHQIKLIDRCSKCNRWLLYSRPHRMACRCGFDLRNSSFEPPHEWANSFHNLFAPWRNNFSLSQEYENIEFTEYFSCILLGQWLSRRTLRFGQLRSIDHLSVKKFTEERDEKYVEFYLSRIREATRNRLRKDSCQFDLPLISKLPA